MSQVEASPFALMTRIFDCIATVSLEWAKMTHDFLPQWDAKKKMPKSLKMPRLSAVSSRQRSVEKSQDDDRPKAMPR